MSDESSVLLHFARATQITIAFVFLVAALSKVRRPESFVRTVALYRVGPRWLARPVAYGVIAAELLISVMLLAGAFLVLALSLGFAVLVLFGLAVGINLHRGRRISCGCFGQDDELISARSVARIVILLSATTMLAGVSLAGEPLFSVNQLAGESNAPLTYIIEVGSTALFLMIAGAWILRADELWAALRPAATQKGR